MIIKFTRNLGNYKKGKIYVCKNDLDITKAKELIKWGFAVEANPFSVSEKDKKEIERQSAKKGVKLDYSRYDSQGGEDDEKESADREEKTQTVGSVQMRANVIDL
ncbi:MAG: hypothetical protein GF347_01565 [Candidatus Moranbacteria bacterium]|nr:hypothetical protein [Candidatus Moranbacteria bacterium]